MPLQSVPTEPDDPASTFSLWQLRSNGTAGAENVFWGRDDVTEFLTPGYFDNDNRADIGVWREMPSAFYFIRRSTAPNTILGVQFGTTGDIVGREADYDGDGRTDPTVVRRTNAGRWVWYYLRSSNNSFGQVFFGAGNGTPDEDIPLPGADYTGDGRADLVVLRQNEASGDTYFIGDVNTGAVVLTQQWGEFSTDFYVTGDYVGDARADFAVWRAAGAGANGAWYILQNGGTQTVIVPFGIPGPAETRDLALCGDYNGDGKDDIAVYRRSNNTYYWLNSPSLTSVGGFLFTGDRGFPVANVPVF
jgi:hypothetical protein